MLYNLCVMYVYMCICVCECVFYDHILYLLVALLFVCCLLVVEPVSGSVCVCCKYGCICMYLKQKALEFAHHLINSLS